MIKIKEVKSKSDIKQFIKTQKLFYIGNPNFVSPIVSEEMKNFDKGKNPLYKHADYQLFIAEKDGKVVGRIAAIENSRHNEIHNDSVGFFGFFESINDQNVANELFDVAKNWLLARGKNIMRGPTNPTFNDVIGFSVDAFDLPPVILNPYTNLYYLDLCENYGMKKAKDLFAYKLENHNYRSEKLIRYHNLIQQKTNAVLCEVDIKNKKQLKEDVIILKELYNLAWEKNWGFVKMTDEEFDFLAESLVQVGKKELTLILKIEGKPVGFALVLPDINQALIHNKSGSMLGAGWSLLTKKKDINTCRIIVLGVIPEYRQKGLEVLLYYRIGDAALKLGIPTGDASWVLEDNEMMNRGLTQTMNAVKYKTFRIYEKNI